MHVRRHRLRVQREQPRGRRSVAGGSHSRRLVPDLYLPLHGAHQGDNAAAALTAVEAMFGNPLDPEVVMAGFEHVVMPGRFEVVGRHPLVILDGAHNPAGADVAATVLDDEFSEVDERIYVVGFLRGRDPVAMLEAMDAASARLVIATAPRSSRAMPAIEVARAATAARHRRGHGRFGARCSRSGARRGLA